MLPTLTRNSMSGLPSHFDSLLRSFLGPWSEEFSHGNTVPPINLWEEDGTYYLEAELPGYALDSIDLEVNGDRLVLSGKREDIAPEGVTFRRKERHTESFERHLQLPADVATDRVEAQLRSGVLRVTLPVAAEKQPRKITVNG